VVTDGDRELLRVLIEERTKYLETRVENTHAQSALVADAAREALARASQDMERRLEGLNELRAQVVEDRSRFVTRELFEAEMTPLRDFRSKAVAIAAGLTLISALAGAALMKAFGG